MNETPNPGMNPTPPSPPQENAQPAQPSAFSPGPPLPNQQQPHNRNRRRRGGRNRHNRQPQGHSPQQATHPVRYEDEPEDPWANQHAHPPTQDAEHQTAAGQDAAHPHHDKIDFPEAFQKLGLENPILHALAQINFTTPSEIQEKMIPVALTGVDVLGQARTGTGKTAAFGLPILQKLDPNLPFQAIVIVPTRELAVQVEAELKRFARHKPLIRFALSYGGTKMQGQLKSMGHQPHVVVGTPGRIMDLQERGALPLNNMRFVVCDEVDRMFDIGFRDDIRKILSFCTAPHQTIFVSATISDDIERMVARHMTNPQRIFTAARDEQLTNPKAQQFYVGVEPWDKQRAIKMLMRQEKPSLALIFCRTKRSVDKVATGLTHDGIAASPIHGDLMQNKRERVMRGFKTGKIHVLVATDLASRGIDVHEITHVINYDIPEDPEAYVHRVGRTARMGASGRAFTFVSKGQGQLQTEIEKLINNLLEEYRIENFQPSPEPNRKHHDEEDDTQAPAPSPTQESAGGTPESSTPPPQEGYQPTGFGHVSVTKSVRPLGGRFPTKRRR
jgi:ATP-dependent RNA helicase DeaD